MTITSNLTHDFYQHIKDIASEVIITRFTIYDKLKQQPDIIRRKDALEELITIFSLNNSVTVALKKDKDHTLEDNIVASITSNLYPNGYVAPEIVGGGVEDAIMDELTDIAYTMQPRININDVKDYIQNQGLTEEDREMIDNSLDNHLVLVITIFLMVIKSENMILSMLSNTLIEKLKKTNRGKTNNE